MKRRRAGSADQSFGPRVSVAADRGGAGTLDRVRGVVLRIFPRGRLPVLPGRGEELVGPGNGGRGGQDQGDQDGDDPGHLAQAQAEMSEEGRHDRIIASVSRKTTGPAEDGQARSARWTHFPAAIPTTVKTDTITNSVMPRLSGLS